MNYNYPKTENQDIPFLLLMMAVVSLSSMVNALLIQKNNPTTVETHWFFIPEDATEVPNSIHYADSFFSNHMDSPARTNLKPTNR